MNYNYFSESNGLPDLSGIIMLSQLSSFFFYATGHQATIPSIRFEAAFTGFYGDFQTVILPGKINVYHYANILHVKICKVAIHT